MQGSTAVDDELTFSLDTGGKACGWLTLNTTPGAQTLTGTNVGGMQTCQFNLNISSKARGTSILYPVKVTMNGTAPSWNVNDFPKQVKFSQIETLGVDLTQVNSGSGKAYLDPGTSLADSNFRVEIDDTDSRSSCYNASCSQLWKINPKSGGGFYLSRNVSTDANAQLEARDVGQQETVVLSAYNSVSLETPVSQPVTITVMPDGNVTFTWIGATTVVSQVNTASSFPAQGSLTDYIISSVIVNNKTLTVKDKVDMAAASGCAEWDSSISPAVSVFTRLKKTECMC